MANGPYENIRLRKSLSTYPESSDLEFLAAVREGRLFVLWEIPPGGGKQHIWMVANSEGQRSTVICTSLDRLLKFHDRLPAQLQTTTYAMAAGPSMFLLLQRAGVDDVKVDPHCAEEADISREEIDDVVSRMGDIPQLQMRVLPLSPPPESQPVQKPPQQPPQQPVREKPPAPQETQVPQQVPTTKRRVDTLAAIPFATAVMYPLLEKRVDDAWEVVEQLVESGQADEALRATALLFWAMIDNGARADGIDPIELLQEGAEAWGEYADLGADENVIAPSEMRALVREECALCHHFALQHTVAWVLWEYAHQTNGPCEVPDCACDGFESLP